MRISPKSYKKLIAPPKDEKSELKQQLDAWLLAQDLLEELRRKVKET